MKTKIIISVLLAIFFVNCAGTKKTTEEELSISVTDCTLYGSLVLPHAKDEKIPLVLIIAGSGPTDRDCNSPLLPGKNNAYKMLAEELQKNGVASFRYDKRGVGKSQFEVKDVKIRFSDYVQDVIAWIEFLKIDDRFSKIIVAGHSEGSLLGMLAIRESGVDTFISLAGSGRPIDEVVVDQYKPQLLRLQDGEAFIDTLYNYIDIVKSGKPLRHVHPYFISLFHPVNQRFLSEWMQQDPAKAIAELDMPVLIIQGTNDIQISEEEAKLLKEANPNAELVIIEGMNHILKIADSHDMTAYSNPELPISPEMITAIIDFIKNSQN